METYHFTREWAHLFYGGTQFKVNGIVIFVIIVIDKYHCFELFLCHKITLLTLQANLVCTVGHCNFFSSTTLHLQVVVLHHFTQVMKRHVNHTNSIKQRMQELQDRLQEPSVLEKYSLKRNRKRTKSKTQRTYRRKEKSKNAKQLYQRLKKNS